jgi:hypothetical protein
MNSSPEFRTTDPDMSKVELLSDLCKEELAAVQTYEKALTLGPLKRHADVLARCYTSHRNCASEIGQRIATLGGEVPTTAGVWGTLIPTLTGAAAAVSEKLAVSLLEESEDRAVRRYKNAFDELDPGSREFLIERILPAQNMTHSAMSNLKHALP